MKKFYEEQIKGNFTDGRDLVEFINSKNLTEKQLTDLLKLINSDFLKIWNLNINSFKFKKSKTTKK